MTRPLWLPTVAAHLRREFLRTFALALLAFLAIYIVADFFDRFDDFLKHGATLSAVLRWFLFHIPQIVTQVTPFAVLTGALVGLGLLARNNEFVALRSCGVSTLQLLVPLLALAAVISVGMFAWNETVVPRSAKLWHEVWNREVKQRKEATLFTGREFWYHGGAGFYDVGRVVPRRRVLLALTVYQLGDDFRPVREIQISQATWTDGGWNFGDARTREFSATGVHERVGLPDGFTLPETFDDFTVVSVEPEEFSYAMLRQQIASLRAKGVDASESYVDLDLKIALPVASIVLMLVAVPLATRGTRVSSLPAAAGIGFTLGFAYFVVLAFARALGQTGALPPFVAAWAANALFALVGTYSLLGSD